MSEETRRDWRTIPVTILANESLSGPVDLGGSRLVGLQMPAAWTAANLSLSVSPEVEGAPNLVPRRAATGVSTNDIGFWAAVLGATNEDVTTSPLPVVAGLGLLCFVCDTPGVADGEGMNLVPVYVHRLLTYSASAYVYCNGGTLELAARWYTGAGAFISESVSGASSGAAGWERLSVSAAAPATAAYAVLSVRTETGVAAQAVTMYWDGVQLEVAAAPSAFSDGGGVFGDPTNAAGTLFVVTAPQVNEFIYISPVVSKGLRYIKLRSGVLGAAVVQAGDRIINLVVRPT